MARDVDQFEFTPEAAGRVLEWMDRLTVAADGWINLLPGVDEEDADQPTAPGAFAALFGPPQAPVTMCTWLPPRPGRRGGEGATIGIMHPRGRFAIRQLAALGVPLPEGWQVRQDHARRGLVVLAPPDAPYRAVLDWTLRAGTALALTPLTGSWQARVHQPSRRERRPERWPDSR